MIVTRQGLVEGSYLSAPTHVNIPGRTLFDDAFCEFVTFCRGTGFQVTHGRVDSGNNPENGF